MAFQPQEGDNNKWKDAYQKWEEATADCGPSPVAEITGIGEKEGCRCTLSWQQTGSMKKGLHTRRVEAVHRRWKMIEGCGRRQQQSGGNGGASCRELRKEEGCPWRSPWQPNNAMREAVRSRKPEERSCRRLVGTCSTGWDETKLQPAAPRVLFVMPSCTEDEWREGKSLKEFGSCNLIDLHTSPSFYSKLLFSTLQLYHSIYLIPSTQNHYKFKFSTLIILTPCRILSFS